MTAVSTNTDVILVNTVLTFLQYGLNTATVKNFLKVASCTFSMKEVKTDVSLLWKSCDLGNVPNSVDDVFSGPDEIACDVINTVTRTEIPTIEPNANDVNARSNVDEGSITVRNDSSNDTSIPAMGKIKTYSAVTNGLKNNPED